jgi:hypothetical protein
MGSPCEPLTARQELIAELEALGYDAMPGVRADWPDWRERLSDDEIRTTIRNIAEIAHRETASGEAEATDIIGEGEQVDFPDVSEMVDAMRCAVACADAWSAANPPHEGAGPEWAAWDLAFASLRALVARIDAAKVGVFGRDVGGSDA